MPPQLVLRDPLKFGHEVDCKYPTNWCPHRSKQGFYIPAHKSSSRLSHHMWSFRKLGALNGGGDNWRLFSKFNSSPNFVCCCSSETREWLTLLFVGPRRNSKSCCFEPTLVGYCQLSKCGRSRKVGSSRNLVELKNRHRSISILQLCAGQNYIMSLPRARLRRVRFKIAVVSFRPQTKIFMRYRNNKLCGQTLIGTIVIRLALEMPWKCFWGS